MGGLDTSGICHVMLMFKMTVFAICFQTSDAQVKFKMNSFNLLKTHSHVMAFTSCCHFWVLFLISARRNSSDQKAKVILSKLLVFAEVSIEFSKCA